ncbi:MAG: hypothetical protein GY913_12590 [Proteobacteria bacterium]|nr:hypothetical protein [Pseudomonadota bacterium]MCP4917743.1 hypothetical protein [Pseudomonadota bacterium]
MAFVPIDISVLGPGRLQLSADTPVDPSHVLHALKERFGPRLVVMAGRQPRAALPFRVRVTVTSTGILCRHDRKASVGTRELDLATLRGALTDAVMRGTWRKSAEKAA